MEAREDRQITVIAPWVYVDYITKGKEYIATVHDDISFTIKDDVGVQLFCLFITCVHIKYRNWIIK